MQECKIVRVGELFEDCRSEIVCIEVKKKMSQNRSLRNTVSQTLTLALLVTSSKGKILVSSSVIILNVYFSGRSQRLAGKAKIPDSHKQLSERELRHRPP